MTPPHARRDRALRRTPVREARPSRGPRVLAERVAVEPSKADVAGCPPRVDRSSVGEAAGARRAVRPPTQREPRAPGAARAFAVRLWRVAPTIVGAAAVAGMAADIGVKLRVSADRGARPAAAAAESRPAMAGALPGAGLFGRVVAAPEAAEVASNLVLSGVLSTADPRFGFAILGADAAHTALYAVDQRIDDARRLAEVYADRVVIDRAGAREVVRLPLRAVGGVTPASPRAVTEVAEAEPALDGKAAVAGEWWAGFRAQAEGGGGEGEGRVVLYPEKRIQRQYRVGPGDVVVSINGHPVADPAAAQDRLAEAVGTEGTMTVLHNGVPREIPLHIK